MSLENSMAGKDKILGIQRETARRTKVSPNKAMQSEAALMRKSLKAEARFMAQERRFIHKPQKSEKILLVSIAFLISIMFCELNKAADSQAPQIIGSWQLHRDDDRPKGPIPKEIMNFWANGKLLISGEHPNKGLYRINVNQLEFLIKKGDRAIPVERQFELSAKELKFKNEKIGWVYYKRVSEQPQGEEPDLE